MDLAWEIILYIFGLIGAIFTIITGYKNLFQTSYDKFCSKISIFFARFTKRAEKAAVSRNIQSNMNSTIKVLNNEFELPELNKVEIKWIDSERKVDAFMKGGGKLILAMEYHHNQDKNILIAARLYVSRCVTNVLQNYSQLELKEAVDLALIQRFLENDKYETTLKYFFNESFAFKQETKDKIIRYYNDMIQMHKRGIFTVIFLNELLRIGDLKYPATQWVEIKEELNEFTDFMTKVANKKRGAEDLETLSFKNNNIKMGIVMIGKSHLIEKSGIERYLDWAVEYVEEGVEKVYLLSSDWKKIYARELLEQLDQIIDIKKSKIREYSSEEYPDSICIYLSIKEK